jgi:signal transduction histidine kinase
MKRVSGELRPALTITLLAVFGLAVGAWALVEARAQRSATEEVLVTEARALAGALGPSLAAAAAATRELDELVTARLLAGARLVAGLHEAGALGPGALEWIVDRDDLDSITIVDAQGRISRAAGEDVPPEALESIGDAVRGRADEVVLVPSFEDGIEHLGVASAVAGGGAVLVRIHTGTGRIFARRIGVENLLDRLLATEGVLYLSYREEPGGIRGEATWDGGPVPAEVSSEPREIRGREIFEVDLPVEAPAGTSAFLRVGLDGAPLVRAAVSAMRRTTLIGIVLVVFSASLGVAALVVRRRAAEREEASRRIAEIETARKRSERLAAAGALTAGLAHEVRGPLNAIVLAAQRIERKHGDETECATFAGSIRAEVRRLENVLRQFLELASPVGDERRPADLVEVAKDVRELLREEVEHAGARIEPVRGEGAAVVDRDSIRRALINLVHNAMEASPPDGAIELELREAQGGVGIHVLDRGSGIDEADAEHLFDAFVTTRAEGTGLGLALVKRVAEEHGGWCRLTRRSGGGTEAVLWLPSGGGSSS